MKKRIIAASLIGLLVLGTSCEDKRDEFLSDYDTRMYFRNSDLQEQDCYITGDLTNYTVSVVKAGSELNAVADASVTMMDEAQLLAYNDQNVTNYSILPSECYTLNGELKMDFAADDLYRTFDVAFNPELIYKLPKANYVLPMVLSSSKTVTENKNVIFVKPNPIIPTIFFEKSGFSSTSLSKSGPDQVKLDLSVIIPLANKWEFEYTVKADKDLLDAYNAEHHTSFQMLPADAYTLTETNRFGLGEKVANNSIVVDKTKLDMGEYVLPLRLTNCTQPYFQIEEEKSVCLVSSIPPPKFLCRSTCCHPTRHMPMTVRACRACLTAGEVANTGIPTGPVRWLTLYTDIISTLSCLILSSSSHLISGAVLKTRMALLLKSFCTPAMTDRPGKSGRLSA